MSQKIILEITEKIKQKAPHFTPKVGIILGSGLGGFANTLEQAISIPYHELPHMPQSTVEGHQGCWVLGMHKGTPLMCMQGRIHMYEGITPEQARIPVRVMKEMGVEVLIITNAAGGLSLDTAPGNLVLIKDHINLSGTNPLIGKNDEAYGPRFPFMSNAYDADLRALMKLCAQKLDIPLEEGVYAFVLGPNIETAAEIRMLQIIGADVVGMSTAPEVIVAQHCGLKTVAISTITNFAEGLTNKPILHEDVLYYGTMVQEKLSNLITEFLKRL